MSQDKKDQQEKPKSPKVDTKALEESKKAKEKAVNTNQIVRK